MKHPNGYGTVYKLSGKRRRPFIARKTIGFDDSGKQLFQTLGYYKNRAEALQELAKYNSNPYDLVQANLTFEEIFERWKEWKFSNLVEGSSTRNYLSAFDSCESIKNIAFKDLKHMTLQKVINDSNKTYEAKKRIRILFNQMYKWAIKHDIVSRDYSENLECGESVKISERKRFSSNELNSLWNASSDNIGVQMVVILIYSGLRISEFLNLKKSDCHLDKKYITIQKSKTDAGVRIVPIADVVLPFWKSMIDRSKCEYVASTIEGKKFTYDNFSKRYYKPLMSEFHMEHTVHETRHTFISLLVSAGVNMTVIKKIVGHKSIMNLTEKVYTHIEVEELIVAVNKISVSN